MDLGHDLSISGAPEVEWSSSVHVQEVLHVLPGSGMVPEGSGLDVCSPEFPGGDSVGTEDVSVNLFEFIPLVVESPRVEEVAGASSENIGVEEGVTVPSLELLSSCSGGEVLLGAGVGILCGPRIWGSGWSS